MDKNLRHITEPDKLPLIVLAVFAVITLLYGLYELAAAEALMIILLILVGIASRKKRNKLLRESLESLTYETEGAKSNTLTNFPLPIAVFTLEDLRVIWGNEMFFQMCGSDAPRLDSKMLDLIPKFSGNWLIDGKTKYPTLMEIAGKKYQLFGNLIHSDKDKENGAFMGIAYWVDVTEYDDTRIEFENTRPVGGVVVIDNLDEMIKNQPDRIKNDIRDAVEDKLNSWCADFSGFIRRYDRDRYILLMEKKNLENLRKDKFKITEEIHQVESPSGISASISIGLGTEGVNLVETIQFAETAAELALSRGGDQTVIKNRMGFEFFGGRGNEVEKRTKVKTRVMANAFAELIRDSERVIAMGHRFGDNDSLGAAVGICAMAKQLGVKANILMDTEHTAAKPLIEHIGKDAEYKDIFITPQEAAHFAEKEKILLAVVDTNRPENVDNREFLEACSRVAVVDHHRVAATYIRDAALSFIEPYASSASELVTEMLGELDDIKKLSRTEAEALLAGIVLDTKSFTLRTGERTFAAAAWLRRSGADTTVVKRLFQTDMDQTVQKYHILQCAQLYRQLAIAAPEEPQSRIVAAQAADDLLNISGVDASIVVAPDGNGGIFASARSIGDLNVQLIMEKLGGGGNKSAAAVQFKDETLEEAVSKVYAAVDEYFA